MQLSQPEFPILKEKFWNSTIGSPVSKTGLGAAAKDENRGKETKNLKNRDQIETKNFKKEKN